MPVLLTSTRSTTLVGVAADAADASDVTVRDQLLILRNLQTRCCVKVDC